AGLGPTTSLPRYKTYVTMSVLKSATSDTRKLKSPHWPGLSVRSGAMAGGTGNVRSVARPAVMIPAELTPWSPCGGKFPTCREATASWKLAATLLILPVRIVRVFQVPQRATAVHGWDDGKVIRGRGRCRGPLECPGIPGVVAG